MAAQLTTADVAARLGVSVRRVQAMIAAGQLPAKKIGRDWIIAEKDLPKVQDRQPGYPKGRPRTPSPKSPATDD